ncbi:hypothetical protein K431DRAFT_25170 [Polychaeton citri CBS 116435]|uniref:Scaffold protein Nfu/NifU N-terminal domain-containing protein n=1 Tax=Polychaeton citri CBS 116435 TaxID=1314669 RepID=A0A9P4PWI4_9PEZI|nr:hypothetical protein K431DRAFT_25170 [Polychaeton citri CBS 116435]
MATKQSVRVLSRAITRPAVTPSTPSTNTFSSACQPQRLATRSTQPQRRLFSAVRRTATPLTASAAQHRPSVVSSSQPISQSTAQPQSKRTIFIQTEDTPNADALKFIPNHEVLPPDFPSSFLEYLSPRSTLLPPHPSPLAANLLNVDGVTSVFYGRDYITVTKDSAQPWAHIKPEVFALITEAVTSGEQIVNTVASSKTGDASDEGQGAETTSAAEYDPEDEEIVGMINELLETRIRPAIQEDGGDIEFRGFHDGQVLLKLRGACRTCDSSTVTLKNGIESMLMHYIEEVKGVQQVMDQEEEISMREFAAFEEKLKQKNGGHEVPTTPGKGSLDTVA